LNKAQALKTLKRYQGWRLGDETPQLPPAVISQAIEYAIRFMTRYDKKPKKIAAVIAILIFLILPKHSAAVTDPSPVWVTNCPGGNTVTLKTYLNTETLTEVFSVYETSHMIVFVRSHQNPFYALKSNTISWNPHTCTKGAPK